MYNRASYYRFGRGRSINADIAESYGRLPRTRAARRLNISVKAFDAGCAAAEYVAHEWHHVGKYAARISFYDTAELREDPAFWLGAASAYRSKSKKSELLGLAADAERERQEQVREHAEVRERFEQSLPVRRLFEFVAEIAWKTEQQRSTGESYLWVPESCKFSGRAWAALNKSMNSVIDVRSMRFIGDDFQSFRLQTKRELALLGTVVSGEVRDGVLEFVRPASEPTYSPSQAIQAATVTENP